MCAPGGQWSQISNNLCPTCAPFKGSFQKYRHFEKIDLLKTPSFSVSAIETHDYLSLDAWEQSGALCAAGGKTA